MLNKNARTDSIYTDPGELTMPLRTQTGREVQSCLVAQLDRQNTPAPDAYVFCGEWFEEDRLAPVTGEWQCRSEEGRNVPWAEIFWHQVDLFSPNTRVTAVNCHY